jgi:hypothetical protein
MVVFIIYAERIMREHEWTCRFLLRFFFLVLYFLFIILFSEVFLGYPGWQFFLRCTMSLHCQQISRSILLHLVLGEHDPLVALTLYTQGGVFWLPPLSLRSGFCSLSEHLLFVSTIHCPLLPLLHRGSYSRSGVASHSSSMPVVFGPFTRLEGIGS